MVRQVFFVSGVYGVGKTTICSKLSEKTGIPSYSASDLISEKNNEQYGTQKSVKDKEENQQMLLNAVKALPFVDNQILLSGHFCIFGRNQEVEPLPDFVFTSLGITKIILLTAELSLILERLYKRDNVSYMPKSIGNLLCQEKLSANRFADILKCSLYIHRMQFNGNDVDNLTDFLLQ